MRTNESRRDDVALGTHQPFTRFIMKRVKQTSPETPNDKEALVEAMLAKVSGGSINLKCEKCSKCSKCAKLPTEALPGLPGLPPIPTFPGFPGW